LCGYSKTLKILRYRDKETLLEGGWSRNIGKKIQINYIDNLSPEFSIKTNSRKSDNFSKNVVKINLSYVSDELKSS
jgi:hypothetical protein